VNRSPESNCKLVWSHTHTTNDACKSNVTPLPASHSYNRSTQLFFSLNTIYFLRTPSREYGQRPSVQVLKYITIYCTLFYNILHYTYIPRGEWNTRYFYRESWNNITKCISWFSFFILSISVHSKIFYRCRLFSKSFSNQTHFKCQITAFNVNWGFGFINKTLVEIDGITFHFYFDFFEQYD